MKLNKLCICRSTQAKKKQFGSHAQIWFAVKKWVSGLAGQIHGFKGTVITSLDWGNSLRLSLEYLKQALFLTLQLSWSFRQHFNWGKVCSTMMVQGLGPRDCATFLYLLPHLGFQFPNPAAEGMEGDYIARSHPNKRWRFIGHRILNHI